MRQQVSIEDIKSRLLDDLHRVIDQYARPAPGSHTTHGRFFTLNPGRADRSVGSFCITLQGPKAGRWNDYATGEAGDVLDLIKLSLGLPDAATTIREARAFLGLDTESPKLRREREASAARARARRISEENERAAKDARRRKGAAGLWLSGQADLGGTPVDHYLRGRGIDLAALGHAPGAIRFHPECRYYFEAELIDQATGEVTRQRRHRPMPAMLTAIARGPEIIDCHRTYLQQDPARGWIKADLPDAKKVFGNYMGGSMRLCGEFGPRGGRLRLKQAPQGARVYVTEGVENALSLMMLRHHAGQPPAFVVAAGMIANLAAVDLPATVAEVVLAADNDSGDQARQQLEAAIEAHRAKGRAVRIWRSDVPGEDLNDALQRALKVKHERGAA